MLRATGRSHVRGNGMVEARSARCLPLLLLAFMASFASAFGFLPPPAHAGLYHPKPAACSFGKDGTSGSTFAALGLVELAFQQEEGRLYLTNPVSITGIYGFDASLLCPPGGYPPLPGFPLATEKLGSATPIAIDNSTLASKGNIYAARPKKLEGYDSSGKALAGFPIPSVPETDGKNHSWTAVAVAPGGEVWAADLQGAIYKFSAAGAEIDKLDVPTLGGLESLAFDADGDLYAAAAGGVFRVEAPGYQSAVVVDPITASAIAVDRESHELYVAHQDAIDRYDSDGELIEAFPATPPANRFSGVAVDEASKAVYTYELEGGANKVRVFEALVLPDVATAALSGLSETGATLNGTVGPDGVALSGCEFEYLTEAAFLASGFSDLSSGGEAACTPAFGSIPSAGTTAVSAAVSGLAPGVRYRFRLSASNLNGTNSSKSVSFALAQPGVETVGSPIRSARTGRLDSRVDPHGIATEYHFEYLTEAAYEANLAAGEDPFAGAASTPTHPAGAGGLIELVSEQVEGLAPATTYRYRVLADNGSFGGAAFGDARTLTTRASDAPLGHGRFPGPPGSDRAWEQVSLPDSSGNPVSSALGLSSDGERAVYQVRGGTAPSSVGTEYDYLFSQRPAGEHPTSGWQSESVYPARKDAPFGGWLGPGSDDALSSLLDINFEGTGASPFVVWRIPTGSGSPAKVYEAPPETYAGPYVFSEDGSRALLVLEGEQVDPAHESPGGIVQLYDVSSGIPQMASLLPGETPCPSGVKLGQGSILSVARSTHWASADGSRAFFPACGHLYMREFTAAQSLQLDGPPLEGPDCAARMIRSAPEAAYFWTQSKLAAEDTAIAGACDSQPGDFTLGGDVYRYDIAGQSWRCLTCVAPGGAAANVALGSQFQVFPEGAGKAIAVAPEGQRLYFATRSHLLPGAAEAGTPAIYRVNTDTEELAYVGPLDPGEHVGENPAGNVAGQGTAVSPDGRFLIFRSSAVGLDELSGSNNANSAQDYLYDDAERSLLCVSCPPDGTAPRGAAAQGSSEPGPGANITPLSEGGIFAFATPTPLVGADQNTAGPGQDPSAGTDVYEWRDGRALLVSDGLTDWPSSEPAPQVNAISPSGRDLFFTEASQLTPDALDGYKRLYDARVGGGIDFPPPKEPCALEVCQGTPKGTPEESAPGSSAFAGAGNEVAPCAKGKHRVKGRCVAKKQRKKAKKQKKQRKGAARHGGGAAR